MAKWFPLPLARWLMKYHAYLHASIVLEATMAARACRQATFYLFLNYSLANKVLTPILWRTISMAWKAALLLWGPPPREQVRTW